MPNHTRCKIKTVLGREQTEGKFQGNCSATHFCLRNSSSLEKERQVFTRGDFQNQLHVTIKSPRAGIAFHAASSLTLTLQTN